MPRQAKGCASVVPALVLAVLLLGVGTVDGSAGTATQPDGSVIVAAGSSGLVYGNRGVRFVFALARLRGTRLDPSFGSGGKVVTPMAESAKASTVTRQSNGKLVAAGTEGETGHAFVLARYNSNGTLDRTFGSRGIVATPVGSSWGALDVALQPDGKIVAAGGDFVIRYKPNGSVDRGFGSAGKARTTGFATSVALQADAKIVVAEGGRLARYNPDGSADTTFVPGTAAESFSLNAVVIQPDGRLVAAGQTKDSCEDFALSRYLSDGSLDPTFGASGTVTRTYFPPGSCDEDTFDGAAANAIALQSNGKIVAGGIKFDTFPHDSHSEFAIARYNANGSLDPNFGAVSQPREHVSWWATIWALAPQPDGSIVAAGGIDRPDPKTDLYRVSRFSDGSVVGTATFSFAFCRVPAVTGLPLSEARQSLRIRHCLYHMHQAVSSGKPGRVIAQRPRAGKLVEADLAVVKLTVSKGRR